MVKVSIDNVEHGMVADEDVRARQGAFVLPRGAVISEAHIRTMRAYGIRDVDILSETPEPDRAAALFDATEARCRELLRPRFAALDQSTFFGQTVFALAARRAATRVLAEGIDLDTVRNASSLLGLPPEKQLFCTRGTDPASLVSGEVELATLPEVYVRLLQALHADKSSAQELAAVVSRDPSLTAKLLRLVNSPHYGSRTPVDTIHRAVSMVGRKELTTLVLGLAAVNAFGDIEPELYDMRGFWRHAAACGVYASLLAAACPGTMPDRAFVGGLLHDIGQLVILRKLPAAAGRSLLLSRMESLPASEAETAVLGFDHTAVGRALLTSWHFPESLTAMVADHHHPDGRPESRETGLVHVADILAIAWTWPAFSGAPVPALSDAAWRSLGLADTVLAEVAGAGDARIGDIESLLFPGPPSPPQ